MRRKLIGCLVLLVVVLYGNVARAQMPHDAIYMPKKQICLAGMYGHSRWNQYWEGSLKRENFNLGTHTTQSVMLMPAIGITDRLNVILAVPYVWTRTSAGNLLGQEGFQDFSGWLKYKVLDFRGLSLHGVVGGSIPMGNYVPDFLPMSIGMQAKTATGRLIVNYTHPATGLYLNGHGSYSWRSKIRVDRDAYQAHDRVYNTNEVGVPNAIDMGVRLGVLKPKWQLEAFTERFSCVDGDYIRRNDMPFPTNKMEMTTAGLYGKIQPKQLGLNARVGRVLEGRNAGQSWSYTVGVLYQFNYLKK
ncbi:hypothetical protein GCM10027275_02020 [Rhabdobacter roseus]|uniref:Transporter n=1 Tax=Rhabdobacter roseus TaxID=1655419 RepID=A0A840TQR3_9BACT|nr:hypothetical protein [Rhabdobacter roseus]MBB5282089.1 hypothetical protein [Rhabdobacter roseus]